jgi:hypothetical protein
MKKTYGLRLACQREDNPCSFPCCFGITQADLHLAITIEHFVANGRVENDSLQGCFDGPPVQVTLYQLFNALTIKDQVNERYLVDPDKDPGDQVR